MFCSQRIPTCLEGLIFGIAEKHRESPPAPTGVFPLVATRAVAESRVLSAPDPDNCRTREGRRGAAVPAKAAFPGTVLIFAPKLSYVGATVSVPTTTGMAHMVIACPQPPGTDPFPGLDAGSADRRPPQIASPEVMVVLRRRPSYAVLRCLMVRVLNVVCSAVADAPAERKARIHGRW